MNGENQVVSKLSPLALGLAAGLVWGLGVLTLGLCNMLFGYWTEWVNLFGTAYIGFAGTVIGSVKGMLWGFLDGFIGALVFAWVYNLCLKCTGCKK